MFRIHRFPFPDTCKVPAGKYTLRVQLLGYETQEKKVTDSLCCAGVTPESHERALEAMKACQIEVI